jgi:hypothetical protein
VPRRRFYQFAAAAAAAVTLASHARAVIFNSTGDVNFNTAAPTGALAGSGWQYQVDFSDHLATAVGPNHIITAAHQGGVPGTPFTYNGVNYFTVAFADGSPSKDFGDLRLLRVDRPILSYAPLFNAATDGGADAEVGDTAVLIGRGATRGDVFVHNGTERGWNWGDRDNRRRWGQNVVTSVNDTGGVYLRLNFDNPGVTTNEVALAAGDSGGAGFILANGEWKLAGVMSGVSAYSFTPTGPTFAAALYDTSGLYDRTYTVTTPASGPSAAFLSRVAHRLADIDAQLNLPPTWKTDANSSWATAANWSTATVPNGVGAIADFRTVITAPRNLSYTSTITVGTLNFDSAHGYTITPTVGPTAINMRLDVASGSAAINVASGHHSVNGVLPQDPLLVNVVRADASLSLGLGTTAQPVTKRGDGTLNVRQLRSGHVTISQGSVVTTANGASNGTSRVGGLSVDTAAGAKVDLANNDMVVPDTPVGAWNGASYSGLTGLIAQAYTFGEWSGPGITSSNAAASSNVTTIAIAPAGVLGISGADAAIWSGQTVDANDVLLAYTYAGDLNMDGAIDGADYGIIDNSVQFPGTTGYHNGDFNFDGVIDGADYGIIDNSIQLQGDPLIPPAQFGTAGDATAMSAVGVSAVPEPAATSLVAFASVALLARRRRRRRFSRC